MDGHATPPPPPSTRDWVVLLSSWGRLRGLGVTQAQALEVLGEEGPAALRSLASALAQAADPNAREAALSDDVPGWLGPLLLAEAEPEGLVAAAELLAREDGRAWRPAVTWARLRALAQFPSSSIRPRISTAIGLRPSRWQAGGS